MKVDLEQLKTEIDLAVLIRSSGIELKSQGDNLIGLCPFHDDKTPSLVVTPKKNLWHCLGACSEGGSAIDWVMKRENVGFKQAVTRLRKAHPHGTEQAAGTGKTKPKAAPEPVDPSPETIPLVSEKDDQAVIKRVIDYYHATLKKSPKVLDYLKQRGLIHPELINRFQLGFADRSLGLKLPVKQTKAGKEIREQLIRLGLFRKSGHEHFTGSLVIPVFDNAGKVTEIYGRKTGRSLRQGTPLHIYLPGEHQGVWNLEAFASSDLILCESLIDALTFWVNGFENVTSSYGINGFTDDHLSLIEQCGIKRVLIAYDNDPAGNQAALKLAEKLAVSRIECLRLRFPTGKDVNETALLFRDLAERQAALNRILKEAEPMGSSLVAEPASLDPPRRGHCAAALAAQGVVDGPGDGDPARAGPCRQPAARVSLRAPPLG